MHSHDVCIVVWLWRPFHKVFSLVDQSWDLEGSIVNAFATFFLLSYLKFINTTVELLIFTTVYVLKDNSKEYVIKPSACFGLCNCLLSIVTGYSDILSH